MKYKLFVYTPILFVLSFKLTETTDVNDEHKLENLVTTWNKSSEFQIPPRQSYGLQRCLEEHQYQITENYGRGKDIILNCFKTTLILNLLKYLGESKESSVKFFNGFVEFEKIPENCENCQRSFHEKKLTYLGMYKKAMEKLVNERSQWRNRTEEEKVDQLNRIEENSEAFLSEVFSNFKNEEVERAEEEKLKKELGDPKLLSLLDSLTKNYMMKVRFYPGASARMMRSKNGGFTFDVEIQESEEEEEEANDSSTREIKDGPQGKEMFDDDDDDDDDDDGGIKRKKRGKKDKKKKKEAKKKAKKLKKIIPYLLLPMLIQMTLLPFVFKKLFFLAMKALFAGKVALILIGFNLLRNTCIKNDDDYSQKIRVEHYGYRQGEEYGAWVNGRSFLDDSVIPALSEEPFRAQKPVVE